MFCVITANEAPAPNNSSRGSKTRWNFGQNNNCITKFMAATKNSGIVSKSSQSCVPATVRQYATLNTVAAYRLNKKNGAVGRQTERLHNCSKSVLHQKGCHYTDLD